LRRKQEGVIVGHTPGLKGNTVGFFNTDLQEVGVDVSLLSEVLLRPGLEGTVRIMLASNVNLGEMDK
jgi:hypothetical protein